MRPPLTLGPFAAGAKIITIFSSWSRPRVPIFRKFAASLGEFGRNTISILSAVGGGTFSFLLRGDLPRVGAYLEDRKEEDVVKFSHKD